ncbi:FKBP-type peptidyl-prolyl cis-trans isomerase [Novilysobacter antarcticus]|uniref:FKBP-type peptidyl-prolyl cis-trans isomerase n=1 Tax=Novilysobacter antarcticus TaxID=2862543 RepID=UPI001FEAB458|nr:FKBP-type peptidyl-prolyl cis-trans isomerase [Lysobacter antarcticus]
MKRLPHHNAARAASPFVLALALAGALLAACSPSTPPAPPNGSVAELQRIDLVDGAGAVAAAGDEISVHYTGWVYDKDAPEQRGAQFDSSRERGTPIEFVLGAGRVIRGWDDGVAGMRVGGKRVLLIPASQGYGQRGAGGVIPPDASLVFEVELMDVRKKR